MKLSWGKSCWDGRANCKRGLGVDTAGTDLVAAWGLHSWGVWLIPLMWRCDVLGRCSGLWGQLSCYPFFPTFSFACENPCSF